MLHLARVPRSAVELVGAKVKGDVAPESEVSVVNIPHLVGTPC